MIDDMVDVVQGQQLSLFINSSRSSSTPSGERCSADPVYVAARAGLIGGLLRPGKTPHE